MSCASNCLKKPEGSASGTCPTLPIWKIAGSVGIYPNPHDSGLSIYAALPASPSSSPSVRFMRIHAHTPAMPYAKRTFEHLSKRRQAGVAWVYLPIPKGEDIIALGLRLRQFEGRLKTQQPCFLVITPMQRPRRPELKSHRSVQNWLVISLLAPTTGDLETLSSASCIQGYLYTTLPIWARSPSLVPILRNVTTAHSYHSVTLGPVALPSSTQISRPPR